MLPSDRLPVLASLTSSRLPSIEEYATVGSSTGQSQSSRDLKVQVVNGWLLIKNSSVHVGKDAEDWSLDNDLVLP